MYFPFLKLQKWCKRSAEIRRRNCAVLPIYGKRIVAENDRLYIQRGSMAAVGFSDVQQGTKQITCHSEPNVIQLRK